MSLSSAISNALSGMRAASTATHVVGNNLANATNETYKRRELVVAADTLGDQGGVRVVGIRRSNNPVMAAAWRESNSQSAAAEKQASHAEHVHSLYGEPTEIGSLVQRLAEFESSLVSAAARPDLTERLQAAVTSMDRLVGTINGIGDGIQKQRERADQEIKNLSVRMNDILANLEDLNRNIFEASSQGMDLSAFQDQRDTLLDELSAMTDIRVYAREQDTIAVYATGGAVLLDNAAAEINYSLGHVITANMTVADGDLAEITINGTSVRTGMEVGNLRGGKLGALFEYRDVTSIEEQQSIDAFAYELAHRMNDPSIDPTRTTEMLGFLRDQGASIDPANLTGLSSRLNVYSGIQSNNGGNPTFLRDGLFASTPGPAGNSALLSDFIDKVTTPMSVAQGQFANDILSITDLAARLTNQSNYARVSAHQNEAFSVMQSDALWSHRLEDGVNSDEELQKLMTLEKSYAANAQVLRTIDEMMDVLLGTV